MVTNLLGVLERESKVEAVLKKLNGLKEGQTIGLAVSPRELTFLRRVYEQARGKNNREERAEIIRRSAVRADDWASHKALQKLRKMLNVKTFSGLRRWATELPAEQEFLEFNYRIFEYAIQRGARCLAIDSQARVDRVRIAQNMSLFAKELGARAKAAEKKVHDLKEQSKVLEVPVAEAFFVKKIMNESLDFAFVPYCNVKEVQRLLTKEGYESRIVSRNKPGILRKRRYAVLRANYRRNRDKKVMERRAKIRRRRN